MKYYAKTLMAGLATVLIAAPILAQQGPRLSRDCIREVVQLCGRDRVERRACLRERFSELSGDCATQLRERFGRNARASRQGQRSFSGRIAKIDRTVLYGSDRRQQVDIYEPDDAVDDLPLILFIHGGGWAFGDRQAVQAKPNHFNANEYYFASTGYRLVPDVSVEQQAADIGEALKALRGQAGAIGFDPDRIVLMGHSAGAHLAALVASDPQYAGNAFAAIKGVVLLDGAGYDVVKRLENARPRDWQIFTQAFSRDPARQKMFSPVTHVGGPDAPNWLALHVESRDVSTAQAEQLVAGLRQNGANAQTVAVSGTDHTRLNRELGTTAGMQATREVDDFLKGIFP